MKRYDSYRDSGIEWIGDIPNHWEVNRVKYSFSFKTGFTPPSGKKEYYQDGSHIWINISDLQDKYVYNSASKITDKAIQDLEPEIVPKSSLLYSFKLSVGRVGFNSVDCYTNEAIFSIVPDGKTNLNFFYYSLPNQIIKNAHENIYGAKILNQELIKNASLIIPPPEEQTTIADYLDRKTAAIDDLIENKKRLLQLYEEEKQAVIDELVTGKKVWNGKEWTQPQEVKDSGIEWLGEIPKDWEVRKLKYVALTYPSNVDKKSRDDEENVLLCNYVDVYKNDFITSDLKFMKATASYNQIRKFELNEGDVLVTKDSERPDDIAIPSLVKDEVDNLICGYHLNLIRPFDLIGNYLFRFLQSEYSKSHFYNSANGVTRFGIGAEKFSNFLIVKPNKNEQKTIVNKIETEIKRINDKIDNINRLINLLQEYRQALISEVVTGKVKVTD